MRLPIIKRGDVLVSDESAGWGDDTHRPSLPHEIVPALILIIEDLQEKIDSLEAWRDRVLSG